LLPLSSKEIGSQQQMQVNVKTFQTSIPPGPKSYTSTKIPTACTLPQEVRPYQNKNNSSEKEQRSERNQTLPVGTAEPQVELTRKPLPPDRAIKVSYIGDKEASLLRIITGL
jgi:hypothetical protein